MAYPVADAYSATSGGSIRAGRYAASVSALFADGVASVVSLAADFPAIGGREVSLSVLSGALPVGVTLDPVGKRLIYDGTPGVTTIAATLQAKANAPKLSFGNATGIVPVSAAVVFPKGVVTGPLGTSELGLRAVVRRTWNDGSAKHVLVCGVCDASAVVTFNTALVAGTTLTSASIQAAAPSAVVDLGVLGSVSLSSLLASPFETWVSTPAMVECHYRGAFAGTDVVAEFHVRLFSNGEMWVRACVENSNRLLSAAVHHSLAGSVSIFGTTVQTYSATLLNCNTQHAFERWSGTQHDVVVNHDVQQLAATRLVPNFGMAAMSEAGLNALLNAYTPNANLGFEAAMGSTGYQDGIGVLPRWDAAYLASGDARAWRSVVAHGKAAHSYRILWRKDGRMLIPTDYPTANAEGVGGGGNNSFGAGGLTFEIAHHPSMGYLAYLLTGDALYADAMLGVAATFFQITHTANGDGTARVVKNGQARTNAWFHRSLGQAAGILPDSAAELATLKTWLAAQVDYYAAITIEDAGAVNSQLGYPVSIGTYNEAAPITVAPWMHNFWIASVGHISDLDAISGASQTKLLALRDWMYRGITGLMGDGSQYCYTYAASYNITVSSEVVPNYTVRTASQLYQTWGEVMSATHGAQTCGTTLLGGGGGGPTVASTGYWGNALPAIAYAVEHSATGAAAAYARLTGASNWSVIQGSGFDNVPQWGVTPRPAPAAVSKSLSLSIVGASVPAWRSAMTPLTWAKIGNTPDTIDPRNNPAMNPNYPSNAPWHGTGGFPTIITGWSGGCLDASNRYHIWGEGHSDGASNAKPYIDLTANSPTWVLPRAPTGAIGNTGTLDDGNLASGVYFDGRPRAQHTYNGMVAVGNKVWVMPGGSQYQGGGATSHVHCFDTVANDWEVARQVAGGDVYAVPIYGGGADYDATRGVIWSGGWNRLSKWEIATTTWTSVAYLPNGMTGGYYNVKYNAEHGLVLVFAGNFGEIWLRDPAANTWTLMTTSGTAPTFNTGVCGIAFDAPRNRYILWDTGANFITLTPPSANPKTTAWVWGTLNAAGGNTITPAKTANGTYGRFFFSETLSVVGCVNATNEQIHVFALD